MAKYERTPAGGYCKNLTSVANLHVKRRAIRTQPQVFCGADTAEFLKIMNEVRLVEVAARKRDVYPIDRLPVLNPANDLLEPLDAAEELWGESDFVPKELNEAPLTVASSLRNFSAGEQTRIVLKLSHGEGDGRVMFQRPVCNAQQPIFENSKLRVDRCCVVEAAEQFPGSSLAPKIGQSDAEIMQFPKRTSEKRIGAARLEVNAQQLVPHGSFNEDALGPRARNAGIRSAMTFQPDYKLDGAVG